MTANSDTTPPIYPDLSVTVEDGVALIEIRRPSANYFDDVLIARIADVSLALDDDPHCRAIVLASQGKHFCAGADLGGHFAGASGGRRDFPMDNGRSASASGHGVPALL